MSVQTPDLPAATSMADGDTFLLASSGGQTKQIRKDQVGLGGGGIEHKIASGSASGAASADIISGTGGVTIDDTYDIFRLYVRRLQVATNDAKIGCQLHAEGGSWDTGTSAYWYENQGRDSSNTSQTAAGNPGTTTDDRIKMGASAGHSNSAGQSADFILEFRNFRQASLNKKIALWSNIDDSNSRSHFSDGGGRWSNTTDKCDGIRILSDGGNIAFDWALTGIKSDFS